ncbi:MAG: hypothetical protein M1299_01635 [Firmicutes bacterium]|nr:hypothetical protein [Bacillota bacterium]MCL5038527.1 hypothetical protein [Bacillota bacterium]
MNSVVILLLAVITALIGYYVYAKYVDEKIIQADPKKATPAVMYMDGVDFMPTSRHVLIGYQFKSIAALGPITGPIIAIQWGWLPALLWILFGVFFIGWVHDYSSAILSMRNEGQSFGALSYRLISPRARVTLLSFIYFYLILILAAFGDIVATMMAKISSVPFAILALMGTGALAGWMIYKKRSDILYTTFLMVALSLIGIYLGTVLKIPGSKTLWVLFALLFSYLGAVLPIWSYTQPINYISFYLVFLGMLGAALGILIGHPVASTPAFTTYTIGVGPLWPILFVTIACGAISGWHSLVSSSGTARQLQNETHNRYVTAGAMFLEMVLAALAIIIASATFKDFGAYAAEMKASGPAGVFAKGMSSLLAYLGIPGGFGTAFAGAIFVILAITVMQLVLRFARIATAELAGDAIPALRNMHLGALLAMAITYLLIATGTYGYIWTLFGGSNQLMASLALMMVTIWLASQKRNYHYALWPMVFMFLTTISALAWTAYRMYENIGKLQAGKLPPPAGQTVGMAVAGNGISILIALFLLVAALILVWDGFKAFGKAVWPTTSLGQGKTKEA